MIELLWVGFGGFVGAVSRFLLSNWVQDQHGGTFPAGTLAVNSLGCFALGLLMASLDRGWLSPQARYFLSVGVLGALTTFSTFSWDTLELVRAGSTSLALVNVLSNVVIGLGAVSLGFWLGRTF